jgi:hypothetical protein
MSLPFASGKRLGPLVISLALSTALGVFLGVIGPFGSYSNGGVFGRILYWTAGLWLGWALFGITLPVVAGRAARRGWPVWAWAPITIALIAVPMALITRIMAARLWPGLTDISGLEWYAQCLIISGVANGLILWRILSSRNESLDTEAADPRDRLPFDLGREVQCLQMEDHYVRVHTSLGSTLVLMPMKQAVEGMATVEGLQTHRSWWVARAAIEKVITDGRNVRLKLSSGLEAPVSRSRIATLRMKGWLS